MVPRIGVVRDILVLVFLAAVLAAGIAPAVHRVRVLSRFWFRRRIQRGTAVMLVYFPFLATVVALIVILVPRLIVDWQMLSAQIPSLLEKNVFQPLDKYFLLDPVRESVRQGPRASVLGSRCGSRGPRPEASYSGPPLAFVMARRKRMRNEMIGAVVRRAMEHPEFRRRLMDNPREALTAHGFALEDAELAEIERIRASIGSIGEVEQRLVTIAERYGVHPQK